MFEVPPCLNRAQPRTSNLELNVISDFFPGEDTQSVDPPSAGMACDIRRSRRSSPSRNGFPQNSNKVVQKIVLRIDSHTILVSTVFLKCSFSAHCRIAFYCPGSDSSC